MSQGSKWLDFARQADQYFVAYACTPHICTVPAYQDLAQSVELYLKAALTRFTGDAKHARQHFHDIAGLLRHCQAEDPTFLPQYVLKDRVLAAPLWNQKATEELLTREEYFHLHDQWELYFIAKLKAQIKYLGANPDGIAGPAAYMIILPNRFWIKFVKQLRAHIGYPPPTHSDFIRDLALNPARTGDEIPDRARGFLSLLY